MQKTTNSLQSISTSGNSPSPESLMRSILGNFLQCSAAILFRSLFPGYIAFTRCDAPDHAEGLDVHKLPPQPRSTLDNSEGQVENMHSD